MARNRISIPNVGEPEDGRVGSQCIKAGGQLFISGQIAYSDGVLIGPGDPLEQCRQCLINISDYVAAAGGNMDDVVSLNIFLSDIRFRDAAITARSEFFSDPGPSATVVGGVDFAFETLLVEISAVAVLG
ncbi:MAG: RidA family protein [Paracoccaceae bacterium]|nr:RidA family protein [Paracoccaceae bacterium]MDG2258698.1 RidA family protein [Paracoccaceae bacterium]